MTNKQLLNLTLETIFTGAIVSKETNNSIELTHSNTKYIIKVETDIDIDSDKEEKVLTVYKDISTEYKELLEIITSQVVPHEPILKRVSNSLYNF